MGNNSRQVTISEDVFIELANRAGISPESLAQGALVQRQASMPSEYLVADDSLGPELDMNTIRNTPPSGTFG